VKVQPKPLLLWKADESGFGHVFSGPTVARTVNQITGAVIRGDLVVGAGNHICCLDATTGAKYWNKTVGGAVHSTWGLSVVDGALMAIGGALDGKVYSLFVENGSEKWDYVVPDMMK
jgi:outer membrane protein assembly factor BamB